MIELQTTWGWLVAVYLFLGGLGAGCFCAVGLISLITGERFRSTVRFGAWVSAVAIALGTLVLLIDVGKPFRAVVMFQSFVNFSSWMTIGAWLLFAAVVVNGLFALLSTGPVLKWLGDRWRPLHEKRGVLRGVLAGIGIPLNLGVAIYTGVLLGVLPFRPFWNTLWLPALFTVSALDAGVGLVAAYATLREKAEGVKKLRIVLEACIIVLIVGLGVVLWLYLSNMMRGAPEAAQAVEAITRGPLSLLFWGIVVALGLGIPLLVCLTQLSGFVKKQAAYILPLVGVGSCLIAGWTLRYVVLTAGLPQTLSSPSLMQILEGVRFVAH